MEIMTTSDPSVVKIKTGWILGKIFMLLFGLPVIFLGLFFMVLPLGATKNVDDQSFTVLVLIGAFLLVWSLWYPLELDLWDYMAVSGAIYFTGAFALLLGGLYWKRASRVGAYLALGAGAINIFSLKPVKGGIQNALVHLGIELDLSGLESEHVGLVSVALCVGLMIAGSLLFPDKQKLSDSHS